VRSINELIDRPTTATVEYRNDVYLAAHYADEADDMVKTALR
jgi:hypothetical protein